MKDGGENDMISVITTIEHLHEGFSVLFQGFQEIYMFHYNAQKAWKLSDFGDKDGGREQVKYNSARVKLIDILHLRTLIQIDSICSCSPGLSQVRKSELNSFCFKDKSSTCLFSQSYTIK